jgi:hypothetical protein
VFVQCIHHRQPLSYFAGANAEDSRDARDGVAADYDFAEGIRDCRAAIKCALAVADAAQNEAQRILASNCSRADNLATAFAACAGVVQGADGAIEALSNVCSRVQSQTLHILDCARELSAMSKKLTDFSSEAEAIVNSAECVIQSVRSGSYNAGREGINDITKRAADEAEARAFLLHFSLYFLFFPAIF